MDFDFRYLFGKIQVKEELRFNKQFYFVELHPRLILGAHLGSNLQQQI